MKKALLALIYLLISTLGASYAGPPTLPPGNENYDYPTILRAGGDHSSYLDNATVTTIHKDQRGFMWFTTDWGLHCYDGVSERNFYAPKYGSTVSHIRETDDELFFLTSTDNGLAAFDRRTERYLPIKFVDHSFSPIGYHFDLTPAGLYAAGEAGLFKIPYTVKGRGGDRFIEARTEKIEALTGPFRLVCADQRGVLYTTVAGSHDLVSYNTITGVAKRIPISLGSDSYKQIYRIFAFDNVVFASAYPNTLACYDVASDNYFTIRNEENHSFNEIRDIVQASPNTFFFATWNGGMRLQFEGKPSDQSYKLIRSPFNHDTHGNFIESRTVTMFCDTTRRILWAGTYGGGVIKYTNLMNTQIQVPDASVYQVTEDKRGYIWISTSRGIMCSTLPKLDRATQFAPFNVGNLAGQRINIYNDQDQYIWLTDYSGHLLRIDQYTGATLSATLSLDGKTPFTARINQVCRDSKNNLWLATHSGLIRSNTDMTHFERVAIDGMPRTRITQLLEDREGVLWAGTLSGIVRLTPTATGMTARGGYEKQIGSAPSLVYVLANNSRGDIIVSYSDKIMRIGSLDKDRVDAIFSLEDGSLPSGHILKILDDKFGNTWFGNNTRIMNMRSGGDQVSTFSLSENSCDGWRMHDGRLVWTSSWGLTYFTPEDLTKETLVSKILLARLRVNNKDINVGDELNGQQILHKNIDLTDTIILREPNNNLELYFSDLSYTEFQKRISYKLSPLDDHWTSHSIDEPLRFTALRPGTYTLTIKPQINGETTNQERTLTIIVKQQWYKSGIFVIFLVILLSIGVLMIYRYIMCLWDRVKLRHADDVMAVLKEREEEATQRAESPDNAPPATRKLLIVGNDKELINKLKTIFDDDFDIANSRDSASALIDSLYHMPQLIIMLRNLSDALDCCRKIKSSTRTCAIPILMIDTVDDPERRVEAVIAQADDYIVLGTDPEADNSLLRRVVENRMAGHEAIHQVYSRMVKQKQLEEGATEHIPDEAVYQFFTELSAMIYQNMKDPTFSAKRLAELMNMSQSTLYRRVMSSSGRTIIETIRDVRLRRASELLYHGGLSIQAISEEVGYQDVATFRKHFVELYGINPSQFSK